MQVKNKVQYFRKDLGLTQIQLAEKALLSLRTIQRVESGECDPKGHTLNSLIAALEITREQLTDSQSQTGGQEVKLRINIINSSSLAFLVMPYGNLILPIVMWNKYKKLDPQINHSGKAIIKLQIFWSAVISVLLVASPFVQKFYNLQFPLMLVLFFVAVCVNLLVIGKSAVSINRGNYNIMNFFF